MEANTRSKAVIELGKRLVEELKLDESCDTLGRWMAHHLADLIQRAEAAGTESRQQCDEECVDVILKLWRHLHELPDGTRPFEDSEPIMRALASLDPLDNEPRYFRHVRRAAKADGDETALDRLLPMIEGIDYTAKFLIGFYLALAAQDSLDKSREWVALAEAAGDTDSVPIRIVHLVAEEQRLMQSPCEKDREALEERCRRLSSFSKIAEAGVQELQRQIASIAPNERDDSPPTTSPS